MVRRVITAGATLCGMLRTGADIRTRGLSGISAELQRRGYPRLALDENATKGDVHFGPSPSVIPDGTTEYLFAKH